MFSCSALRLVEFVNNQTAAQLWLEPCGFRRHDFPAVGNGHDLIHRHRIECEGRYHFSGIDSATQFIKSAQTANEIYAVGRAQIFYAENLVENKS